MLFLESLIKGLDGCSGALEVLTILFDVLALYLGVKAYQKHKHLAEKLAHHHAKAPLKKTSWWPFAIALALGVVFTALTVYKYSAMAS